MQFLFKLVCKTLEISFANNMFIRLPSEKGAEPNLPLANHKVFKDESSPPLC